MRTAWLVANTSTALDYLQEPTKQRCWFRVNQIAPCEVPLIAPLSSSQSHTYCHTFGRPHWPRFLDGWTYCQVVYHHSYNKYEYHPSFLKFNILVNIKLHNSTIESLLPSTRTDMTTLNTKQSTKAVVVYYITAITMSFWCDNHEKEIFKYWRNLLQSNAI